MAVLPSNSQSAHPLYSYEFPYCRDCFTHYEKLQKVGHGTFGEVFKARPKNGDRRFVALKKIIMDNEKEGFPITAIREIKILQLLKHDNVIRLLEICRTKATQYNRYKATFYLVCEFCDHDLAGLLSNCNVKFNLGDIKKIIQQILNGLYYIHGNKVLHRDMKAANVLVTKQGVIKLADFGLARATSQTRQHRYTNRVVTLWYRAPELLLGSRNYGPAIDVWSTGCIMAELWTRTPIMQGGTEQVQLKLITQLCGSITPEVWPTVTQLELYGKISLECHKRRVKERLKSYVRDQYALDLLDKLLTLDPSQRITTDDALQHDLFYTDPMPSDLSKTLQHFTTSMFELLAPPRRSGAGNQRPPRPPNTSSALNADHHVDRVF